MDAIFRFAIFIVIVMVLFAMLQWAMGDVWNRLTGSRFWGLIQIVVGGVVAILVLLFIWRFAECAGLMGRW